MIAEFSNDKIMLSTSGFMGDALHLRRLLKVGSFDFFFLYRSE